MRRTGRLLSRASLGAIGLGLLVGPAALGHPGQHGGSDGHLPPVSRNVELVGKLDLFAGGEQPGRIADVAAFGDYAYLGAFASPNCEKPGVYVVDISNPRAPREADFIPTSDASSFVGEGVQVLDMDTESFQGQVLLYNNETCAPNGGLLLGEDPRLGFAGPGGATLVDVTEPEEWNVLADHVGDNDPPPAGALPSGFPHNSHSVFGWQQGAKWYMAVVDNGESGETDIDIFDITDPRNPALVVETGMAEWPRQDCNPEGADDDCPSVVQEDPSPNGSNPFIHDFVVKQVGDRHLLLGSYWDGGYVVLDVTDPADGVEFLRDTDFGPLEPFSTELGLGEGVTPEGNAHQAEFNHDNSMFIGTDEDFGPFRLLGTITSGQFENDAFTGTEGNATPPIDREEGLAGPTQFIGQGCGAGTPAPSGDHIALTERGGCTFSLKVATAENLGYKAVLIFNDAVTDAPNCDAQVNPLAIGDIPSLFVGRSAGLKLLNTNPGANSCDVPTPAPGPGESFTLSADFDGWGYLHLYDANTMEAIDHFAIPESLDESKADGFGDLSVHEVAMDRSRNRAYISYYSGGFRVLDFSREGGIQEVGAYIEPGGNNFWGVETHYQPGAEEPLVLASDRDAGLYIFRYTGDAAAGGGGGGATGGGGAPSGGTGGGATGEGADGPATGDRRGGQAAPCVRAARGVRGKRLGPASLGRPRASLRARFAGAARRARRRGMDRYCLRGGGSLRIGYPTGRLNRSLGRSERRRVRDRAILILTTSGRYSIRGLTVGSSIRSLRARLQGARSFRVGRNVWFLERGRSRTHVFKTRRGRVLEIGVADRRLTRTERGSARFLRAWQR